MCAPCVYKQEGGGGGRGRGAARVRDLVKSTPGSSINSPTASSSSRLFIFLLLFLYSSFFDTSAYCGARRYCIAFPACFIVFDAASLITFSPILFIFNYRYLIICRLNKVEDLKRLELIFRVSRLFVNKRDDDEFTRRDNGCCCGDYFSSFFSRKLEENLSLYRFYYIKKD